MTKSAGKSAGKSKTPLLVASVVALAGAIAVLFVLPAETGYDPTGVGAKLGLTEIADPVSEEVLRGNARMEQQEVLVLADAAPAPIAGVIDSWEYELGPFDSIEFKYTLPEGARMAFSWQATGSLHYDLHAHTFTGGEAMTEGYGLGDAEAMHGTYVAPFSGIHGWFWQNRSLENVTVRIEASGGMTGSTIFSANGETERPLAGAAAGPRAEVAGHEMRADGER